jgi:hypothetical protein
MSTTIESNRVRREKTKEASDCSRGEIEHRLESTRDRFLIIITIIKNDNFENKLKKKKKKKKNDLWNGSGNLNERKHERNNSKLLRVLSCMAQRMTKKR